MALFFGRRQKTGSALAVCLESEAVAMAAVRAGSGSRPALVFADYVAVTNESSRRNALESWIRQGRLQGRTCSAVLPVNSYQTIQVDLADLSPQEGRQAARWQIGERLDYPTDQAIIDLYRITPYGGEKRPHSYAVAARNKDLRGHVDEVKAAGLKLASINIPEFALRNICELFEDQRGVALLLLLENSGLLVVVRDGVLYLSRQLTMGMDNLLSVPAGDSASLLEQFDTIVLDIQRSFDFCESTYQLPLVSRLLVAQTRQELPELISHLDNFLATTVEPLRLDRVLELPANSDPIMLHQQLLAIGGALRRENV